MMQVIQLTQLTARALVVTVALAGAVLMPLSNANAKEFQVVGTAGDLDNWKNHESRFWSETLPKASSGEMTANVKPYTELGLSGIEVMRLLKFGTYDAVHAHTSYVVSDSPVLEGVDLAGVVQDFATYRRVMDAYAPIIARELETKYNAKLLALYPSTSHQLWCNLSDKSSKAVTLKSLVDKKIRTHSTTLSDFIAGVDSHSVTLAFSELVPAIERGLADCGVAGAATAYDAKWWQVVTHNLQIRLGFGAAFLAMNLKTWMSLSEDHQKVFLETSSSAQDSLWEANISADRVAMDCNADGPCGKGKPGGVIPVRPNQADSEQLSGIVEDFVLARWARRCGKACVKDWNDTIGKVVGLTARIR